MCAAGVIASLAVAGAASADDPPVEGEIERVSSATEAEMITFAASATSEMRGTVKSLARMDDQVRSGADGEGLPCVTNNLAAARSLLQVSEGAQKAMARALELGERPRAEHEYRKIAIALKKVRGLYAEGERCAYGEGVSDGKTRVRIEGEPVDADQDETASVPDDVLDYGFDPPNASPF
jgi:hypothetical protein